MIPSECKGALIHRYAMYVRPWPGGQTRNPNMRGGGSMKNGTDPLEIMSLFQRVMIVFLLMFAAIGVVAILSAGS